MHPGDTFETIHIQFIILMVGTEEIIVLGPLGIISFSPSDEIFAGF